LHYENADYCINSLPVRNSFSFEVTWFVVCTGGGKNAAGRHVRSVSLQLVLSILGVGLCLTRIELWEHCLKQWGEMYDEDIFSCHEIWVIRVASFKTQLLYFKMRLIDSIFDRKNSVN